MHRCNYRATLHRREGPPQHCDTTAVIDGFAPMLGASASDLGQFAGGLRLLRLCIMKRERRAVVEE